MLRHILAVSRLAYSLLHRQNGSVAPLFALAFVPIVGFVGASVDYSRVNALKTKLQAAMDAAVIVGARDGTSNRDTVAQQMFASNAGSQSGVVPTFTLNADGSYSGTATTGLATEFMGLLGVSSMSVAVTATAKSADPTAKPFCVMALNATAPSALKLSGNSSVKIAAPQCTVLVNSSADPAVDTSGNASINSGENCFVGTSSTSGNSSLSPPPNTVCQPKSDPFAGYSKPTPGACNHTNFSATGGTLMLQPGVYCGGIKISGASTVVTFAPGLYIIKDGPLSSTGGGSLTGDGVTFYLTGTNAGLQISGSADWHLVASNSEPFPSFVFFLDPAGPSGLAATASTISGSGELYFEGVIYLPKQLLSVTGNGTALGAAPFTSYIADTLKFSGNGSLTINMDIAKTTVAIPAAILAGTGGLTRLVK